MLNSSFEKVEPSQTHAEQEGTDTHSAKIRPQRGGGAARCDFGCDATRPPTRLSDSVARSRKCRTFIHTGTDRKLRRESAMTSLTIEYRTNKKMRWLPKRARKAFPPSNMLPRPPPRTRTLHRGHTWNGFSDDVARPQPTPAHSRSFVGSKAMNVR
jgi:hypothetical protein